MVGVANPSKARGTAFEKAVQDFLRGRGFDVDRLRTTGAKDEGDLAVREGNFIDLLECKATKCLDASGFMLQAMVERDNYASSRGLSTGIVLPYVVWKRRSRPVSEALIISTLGEFFQ